MSHKLLMLNKTPAAATNSVIALLPDGANRAPVRFRMTSSNPENGFVGPAVAADSAQSSFMGSRVGPPRPCAPGRRPRCFRCAVHNGCGKPWPRTGRNEPGLIGSSLDQGSRLRKVVSSSNKCRTASLSGRCIRENTRPSVEPLQRSRDPHQWA